MSLARLCTIGLVIGLASPVGARQVPEELREFEKIHEGGQMTAEQAAALEQALEDNPDDLAARTKLLGYYFYQRLRNSPAKAAGAKHILWFIENRPDSSMAGPPYASLSPSDGEPFKQVKALWLKQTGRHAKNPAVLGNAADFLSPWDKETARKLLQRAIAADPLNPTWHRDLAHLYHLQTINAPTLEAREQWAAKALAEQRRAVELAPDERERLYHLTDLPEMALDAARPDEARAAAEQLIELARRHPKAWNHGNAMHNGHIALGRLALRSGDVEGAKRHLLEAGRMKVVSSPPDLTLAGDLLERGDREAVIRYLESAGRWWHLGRKQTRLDRNHPRRG